MKRLCEILFCVMVILLSSLDGISQQDAQYTQYMFNGLTLNPAYAGSRQALSAVAFYRNQWVNIEGAPKTMSLSAHSPVGDKIGVGLFGEFDKIGVHQRTTIMGSYAYKFLVGGAGVLSAGVQAGILNYRSNWSDVMDATDQNIDPAFGADESKLLPNFGFGLFYNTDRFYLGFSVPHLINNKLSDVSKLARQYRHYFLTGGAVLKVSNDLKLKPSFLIKSIPANAPLSVDLNLNLLIKEVFWIGASYRLFDSFDFLVEFLINKQLRIGYSYDLTQSELAQYTSGSHEIMLGYDLYYKKERVITPRYF